MKSLGKGIVEISVDNPGAFNALSSDIIVGLVWEFQEACSDLATRVIIFRGGQVINSKTNEVKFLAPLAGADLTGLVNRQTEPWTPLSADVAREHMEQGVNAIATIRRACQRNNSLQRHSSRVVVIGMVDGPCLAGGVEFMFGLSDIVLATHRSTFGMREILLAGMGGWGGPQILRRLLVSPLWVNEMLLALGDQKGGDISAETALRRGLLNRLVTEAEIEGMVLNMAEQVTRLDPLAVDYNLGAVEHPINQDCTPWVTDRMVELMLQPPWVERVQKFLQGGK